MADNLTTQSATLATIPASSVIATDDVSSVHYQYVKLASSTSGSSDLVGELDHGSTVSLYVHSRPDTVIPSTPINSSGLTTATTAYTAGDVLGAGWTVPNAAKASGGTGRIVGVTMVDYSDIVASVTLYFFDSSVTFGSDNAGPSISDADSLKAVGAPLTVYLNDVGSTRIGGVDSISIPYYCSGGTDLYVYAVTNVGHTFFGAATDLKLRVALTRD